ncbi:class II aldolase/adducin family protein [Spirillospora sp. NBC_00431]
MLYEAERELIVRTVADLTRWGSLDPNGGGISLRTASGDIVSTTASGSFSRWQITTRDIVVCGPDGSLVERTGDHAPVDTPLQLAAYREFEHCNAIVHAHAPYSLAFASLGLGVPSVTTHSDRLGEVPCLSYDDHVIRADVEAGRAVVRVPECMRSRPEVVAGYELGLVPQMLERIGPRAAELERHGLGFVVYRHGAFTLARTLGAAAATLGSIEHTARTSLFQAVLQGGLAGVDPEVLSGTSPGASRLTGATRQ